ncbi:Putative general secretion pathway protein K [Bradyrhizobium sp. ORS 278]|uniref:general secretion pathway protein GspK n=1 Tax=Bradyrhizobium sp. (strain ORS 278) TaxID=114615 RepID=UPI0001507E45|nr:type II secretion system protein GspK [Bradyrhizobium sp. ORS 278]CAL75198.1 Putative general secretion pathway protein K [Bradyrhizobium sp. ORS 278]
MPRHRQHRSSDHPGERGFVLVAVLWILISLAGLAGALSVYLHSTAQRLSLDDARLRSAALETAGLELAAYQLSAVPKSQRAAAGAFSFRLDHAQVSVAFRSEAARIDLNHASKQMLANLFGVLGARADKAGEYAERIVAWRTPLTESGADSERDLYRTAGVDYTPRGALFAHVEELRLVLSLPPELVDKAMPFVTVFSGRREIDALEAAPEVVAALPGITQDALRTFLDQRAGLRREPKALASALGPARTGATLDVGDAMRVWITIVFDAGRRAAAEAVILLSDGDEPYQILAWRDVAGNPAMLRPTGRAL